METKRLDKVVVSKFLLSRSAAIDSIKQGRISVNGIIIDKPSHLCKSTDNIKLLSETSFVSRGGHKLHEALIDTGLDVQGKMCLDVGASTGGFTDCLLQHKAASIVTVDVGSDQLHPDLRSHPFVTTYENMNIKDFAQVSQLHFDIIVVDVSFTSLKHVFESIHPMLNQKGDMLLLFKPQFEVGKEFLNKKGIVKQRTIVEEVLNEYVAYFKQLKYESITVIPCRLKGKQGNQEYFIHLSR